MAYTDEEKEEKFLAVINHIADNGYSLRKACAEVKIPRKTFYEWIDADKEKSNQYARACEERADAIADEILDIADESANDLIEQDLGDGIVNTVTNHEAIQRSKLRVDARKWLLGKLAPKKYGDKLLLGGDPENPIPSIPLVLSNGKTYDDLKNELQPE